MLNALRKTLNLLSHNLTMTSIIVSLYLIVPSMGTFILIYFIIFIAVDGFIKNMKFNSISKYSKLLESPEQYNLNSEYINLLKISEDDEPLVRVIDVFCRENKVYETGAIVSLSGGVDSMVTLAILLYLKQRYNFSLYTASINYGLREESIDEINFLREYTDFFGITSYVSEVKNLSRKKSDSGSRTEFESASRIIRFDTYKQIIQDNFLSQYSNNIGVFVAHHKDDIVENIFTNIMKGGDVLDLEVMKPISTIHDVIIFRPLLSFKKQVIYDFAHKYDIPYFLDTTPDWSRRGKMRNEIFPLLDSVFGIDWHNKMKNIGSQSNEFGNYINQYIIDPWFELIEFSTEHSMYSKYIIIPIKEQPKLIYSKIIMKSLHNIGERMIKQTSMNKIMVLINHNNNMKEISLDGNRYAKIDGEKLHIYKK